MLEVDAKAKRISLGLKQLEPDPWTLFTEKYKPGDKIGGKVRCITDYGVFIGIEEGVDGMVHKSDLSWTAKVNNPSDLYNKGDDVEAIILSINHDEKKVSLGVKQLWDDPWPTIFNEFPPGKVVEVKVVSASSTTACSCTFATASRASSRRTTSSSPRTKRATRASFSRATSSRPRSLTSTRRSGASRFR